MIVAALIFLFLLFSPSTALAAYNKNAATTPRPLIIHTYSVDLSDPSLDILVTPRANLGTTTSKFLADFKLNVAVNGDEWTSLTNPKGLNASLGDTYSPDSPEPTMYISENNQITFDSPAGAVFNAISGSHTLIIDGKINPKFDGCSKPEYCTLLRSRTAVGVTSGNKLLL